jgi:hypothetical protein
VYRVKLTNPDGTYEVKRLRGRNEAIDEADRFVDSGGIRAAVFVDTPDGLKPTYTRSRNAEDLPAVKEV